MANPLNDDMKAAQFIQKLIQESKDQPSSSKFATKLYVILQHMKCIGKENSMTYQVVLRAMETAIKEHNLDNETLMSSRLPLAAGAQIGDSALQQLTGSSQRTEAAKESKSGTAIGTPETYTRVHSGPASGGQDMYQGSAAHIGNMANPQNVELKAAKFLHKLIQETKDEPSKLATKLYVILQHMKTSGKENSMPYQITSRAMETVIKEHNLDIETLMPSSSRLPLAAGAQIGDWALQQLLGSSQQVGAAKESKSVIEICTPETYASTKTHGSPVSGGQDMYRGSAYAAHIGEPNLTRTAGSKDTGKSLVAQASNAGFLFKEQQLKQLKAQCLVFLALRDSLIPTKVHLESALGGLYKEAHTGGKS